jgi:hypothetical protein
MTKHIIVTDIDHAGLLDGDDGFYIVVNRAPRSETVIEFSFEAMMTGWGRDGLDHDATLREIYGDLLWVRDTVDLTLGRFRKHRLRIRKRRLLPKLRAVAGRTPEEAETASRLADRLEHKVLEQS